MTTQHTPQCGCEGYPGIAFDFEKAKQDRNELLVAIKAMTAALTQPVQFTGSENPMACYLLRADAAAAVSMANAALAKVQQ